MKTTENTLFGFAKISKEIILNPKSGFSSAMIHLYIIISEFAKTDSQRRHTVEYII